MITARSQGKAEVVQRVLEVQSLPGSLPAQLVRPEQGEAASWAGAPRRLGPRAPCVVQGEEALSGSAEAGAQDCATSLPPFFHTRPAGKLTWILDKPAASKLDIEAWSLGGRKSPFYRSNVPA